MPKKQLIISTARSLFFKFGLKKVSIEEIVNEAKISKATFYRYFSNKTDLAKTVLDESLEQDMDNFKAIIADDTEFSITIEKIVQLHEKTIEDSCEELFSDAMKYYPEVFKILEDHNEEMLNLSIEFLQDNQRRGNIRPELNVNLVATALFTVSESIVKGDLDANFSSRGEYFRQVTDMFFYGIINK